MAGPLVLAPYLPAAGKAAATGWKVLGPVLKYGPTTLRAIDTFRTPPQLGPATQDVGRQQRLRELVDDALAGARVQVASLPMPQFPGGPMFPLNPGAFLGGAIGRALLQLFQQGGQEWGRDNSRGQVEQPQEWLERDEQSYDFPEPTSGTIFLTASQTTTTEFCNLDIQDEGTSEATIQFSFSNAVRIEAEFENLGTVNSPCGDSTLSSGVRGRVRLISADASVSTSAWTGMVGGYQGSPNTNTTQTKSAGISGITANGIPLNAPNKLIPGGEVTQFPPIEQSLGSPLPLLQPAPLTAPAPTSPASTPQKAVGATLPVPGAASVPSNPPGNWAGSVSGPGSSTAAGGSVGTLAAPAVALVPLPAFVPRPLPGPTLPEFEPEPERKPLTPPGTVPITPAPAPQPKTPQVVPGSVPGTTPTVFPVGDPPTAPGTDPGTTPTPSPSPAPSPSPSPGPAPAPGTFPAGDPVPSPSPSPGPSPSPSPAPAPAPSPSPAPSPGPSPSPAPAPSPSPTQPGVVPAPGPASTPTTLPGEVPAPAPLPVPVTSPETDFPVPGGVPVTGVSIRPDLKAIAREVGRIEGKTAQLLNGQGKPPGGGNGESGEICRFQPDPIWQQILEILLQSDLGGSYTLQSPCGGDGPGEPGPPVQVDIAPSLGLKGTIVNRLDALAELLQVHKDLKQPMCTPGRAVGQPVTVTFEEVQEEPDA